MVDQVLLDEVVRLTGERVSARVIADRMRVSTRTVQRYRRRAKLTKPHVVYPPELWATAKQLIDDEMNFTQVASVLGVSRQQVARKFPDAPRLTPQEYGHLAELYRNAGL